MDWRLLAELIQGKYSARFLGVVLLMISAALLESLQVALFFPLFVSLSGGSHEGRLALLTQWLSMGPWDGLVNALVALLLVTVLKGAIVLWRDRDVALLSGTVAHHLKLRLMKHYADSSYTYFLESKHAPLIYAVTTASTKTATFLQKSAQLIAEAVRVAAIAFLMLLVAPVAMLAVALVGLGYQVLTWRISAKVSYHTGKGRVGAGTEQVSVMNEFFGGVRQIMAFGSQKLWSERLARHSQNFRDLFVKDSVWLSVPKILLDLFMIGLLAGGLLIMHWLEPLWLVHQLPLLAVFAMSCLRLLPSLTQLGHVRMELTGLRPEVEQVRQILQRPRLAAQGTDKPFPGLRRDIQLEQVEFSYPGRAEVLRDISLSFSKGTMTALVGPSGGGKTTLAHLLLGLLTPTRGRILVDDAPLESYALASWRGRIGFVPQESFIFYGSIEENITFGRDGFSRDQVIKAAEIAHAHEFISQLPQGYDTLVGERGMKLSGGQQQRLAIARAVLHHPEILILDEATSFLDTESEQLVQAAIERVSQDRTVILIAHRLSTVERAHRVVVIEGGRVVEQGPPSALLRDKGRYHQLFSVGSSKS